MLTARLLLIFRIPAGQRLHYDYERNGLYASVSTFSSLSAPRQPFRFIYVSGGGATQKPTVFTPFYGRMKSETKTLLLGLRTPRLLIESAHPAGVEASSHDAVKPNIPDPGLAYNVAPIAFGPLF